MTPTEYRMSFEPNTVAIRASSFGGLFDCALKFEAEQIHGYRMPNSPRALIGTGTHSGTGAFDKAKLDGAPISVYDAAGITLDSINERISTEGVQWSSDEPSHKEVERIALRLTATYCSEISPNYTFEAVELTTKPLEIDCGKVVVRLTGTLDRCRVRVNSIGRRGISDVKTGRAAVSNGVVKPGKHRAQLGTYELLYAHTTGLEINEPAEIIGMNTSGAYETGTGLVDRPRDLLLGDESNRGLIEYAAAMYETGLFPPNPQSMLCSKKYCAYHAQCPYANDK